MVEKSFSYKEVQLAWEAGYVDGLENLPDAYKAAGSMPKDLCEPQPVRSWPDGGETYAASALDVAYVLGARAGIDERKRRKGDVAQDG